jgi:hypothetical protein
MGEVLQVDLVNGYLCPTLPNLRVLKLDVYLLYQELGLQ